MLISTAYAQSGGGPLGDNLIGTVGPLVLIFVVFYFLLIRPQQKKAKAHREMITNVRRGDQVVTGGGIIGKVTKVVSDDRVQVEIADNVRVEIARSTIADVLTRSEPVKDDKKDDAKDGEKK
ncbi:MAG: preprotein translocase subunit YajC [Alphaproteobacteria bacterium]|nr:preprotein translocase subunit YajC [Alphaproteobacteria bacterium]